MTSVHVITAENRSSYRHVLDAYHGARHEVFHETDSAQVFADLTRFLDGVLGGPEG